MVEIKNIVEITKEDTTFKFAEGDNVICVTLEGRLYIGNIEIIGAYEGKEAIRLNTSDIKNPYQYSCSVIFIEDIEYMLEDNDANKEIVIKLMWEQYKEEFVNSFAELGFDMDKIEQLYYRVRCIAHINNVAMADIVKCLVYSVEKDVDFKEYLLGIE